MKIENNHKEAIINYVDHDCSITLESIRQKLKDEFDLHVSIMTIGRCLKTFHYTLKRTTLIPERRNDDRSLNDRENYANKYFDILSTIDEGNLYFVDEVGFNVSMRCKRGRSLHGSNAVQKVSALRTRNISVCCAISKNGISKYYAQTTAFNTNNFTTFISSLMDYIATERPGRSVIIMDNVPFHKSKGVKEIIEGNDHIIQFLPPYSPFLNPIENMFSKWKQSIRRERPENERHLFDLIHNVRQIISPDDCAAYYRHMLGFLPNCLKREVITEG